MSLGSGKPSGRPSREGAGDRINPVALITGAASGIGAACAQRLAAKAGGGLLLVDRDEAELEAAADALVHAPERVSTLAFDVADAARWRQAAEFIADHYGRLDYAVVSTEVSRAGLVTDASFDDWRRAAPASLDGAFLTLRSLMPLMRVNLQGGAIVLTGAAGMKDDTNAGRGGLLQLMRTAAKEGEPNQIRVNAVASGAIETALWRNAPVFQDLVRESGAARAALDRIASLPTPLARYAGGDDVAQLIDLLLTDGSAITGATLVVEGGYTL